MSSTKIADQLPVTDRCSELESLLAKWAIWARLSGALENFRMQVRISDDICLSAENLFTSTQRALDMEPKQDDR